MQTATVSELKKRLDNNDDTFLLIDVREPWEYEESNLGGKLIPLGELMNRVYELEDYKEQEIIVHCRSGARSAQAAMILEMNGFTNVRNLTGGILEWKANFG